MPNIEIHGLGRISALSYHAGLYTDIIHDTLKRIKDALSVSEFRDETVITVFDSYCIDTKCSFRPFLRIYDTDDQKAEAIARILHNLQLGSDIEIVRVEKFIPG